MRASRAREALALAPFLVLAYSAVLAALTGPPIDHDAVAIWYPKLEEVSETFPPEKVEARTSYPFQAHPHYPRGLAWLASTAAPFGAPDARLVRLVPLLFGLAMSLAMAGAAERRGNFAGGVAAAAIVLGTSEFLRTMHVGFADAALAGAILLAGIGVTRARETGGGLSLAAAAAAGAGSIKAEGLVITLAVGLFVLIESGWPPSRWRRGLVPAGLVLALALPWWVVGVQDPSGGPLYVLPTMLNDPAYFLERLAKTPKDLFLLLVDPGAVDSTVGSGAQPASAVTWVAAGAIAVCLPGRMRGIAVWPAIVLLLADFTIYVLTPCGLGWHIFTSARRLLVQALPLLVFGATLRLTGYRLPIVAQSPS